MTYCEQIKTEAALDKAKRQVETQEANRIALIKTKQDHLVWVTKTFRQFTRINRLNETDIYVICGREFRVNYLRYSCRSPFCLGPANWAFSQFDFYPPEITNEIEMGEYLISLDEKPAPKPRPKGFWASLFG